MFDDLIDIFSGRNLFTPLVSFFEDIIYGPGVFFIVPSMAGFSKAEIRRLLHQYKIFVWGDMYDGDVIIFSVNEKEARWTYRVLRTAGVPVISPKFED